MLAYTRLVKFFSSPYIEFSVGIGCPVYCRNYCPQEVTVSCYNGKEKVLSLENFRVVLDKVPKRYGVAFSGFCEPFVSQELVDMICYAEAQGREIVLSTTLHGATEADVNRLVQVDFVSLGLHLPDGENAMFPLTEEYMKNVFKVLTHVPTVAVSLMNSFFRSNNREEVSRGFLPKRKRHGYCRKLVTPQFVVLPNGDVHLCCMDFGLWHKLGNLLREDYAIILSRWRKQKRYSLCCYCSSYEPLFTHWIKKIFNLLRSKLL